jgi:hypothetical protein
MRGIPKMSTKLTAEIVRELLTYDPHSGELRWRRRKRKWFETDGDWWSWNAKYAGKAFGHRRPTGSRRGAILGEYHLGHRLSWFWVTGRWPASAIYHINRNAGDNRWRNLRERRRRGNRFAPRNSRSGKIGAHARNDKWSVRIRANRDLEAPRTFHSLNSRATGRKRAEGAHGHSKGFRRVRLKANTGRC